MFLVLGAASLCTLAVEINRGKPIGFSFGSSNFARYGSPALGAAVLLFFLWQGYKEFAKRKTS